MTMLDKIYNPIFSEYNKKLLAEHKANFSTGGNGLSYFVTYLRMLRDYHILAGMPTEEATAADVKAATLTTALAEFDNYQTCITKYYRLNGETVERIGNGTEEEVAKKYNSELKFHWTNFWQLVMANIEDWAVNG